jgi:hypothetical protein
MRTHNQIFCTSGTPSAVAAARSCRGLNELGLLGVRGLVALGLQAALLRCTIVFEAPVAHTSMGAQNYDQVQTLWCMSAAIISSFTPVSITPKLLMLSVTEVLAAAHLILPEVIQK